MTSSSTEVDRRVAALALAVIDLRAHFEAQLRTVARAEEALIDCRTSVDPAALEVSAAALRDEVAVLSDNNQSVRAVIDQMALDARQLACPVQEQPERE
jgi:hypothetical protein